MEEYPYFQVRWNKGLYPHVVHILVSENRFEDLTEEYFGDGPDEIFFENQSICEGSNNNRQSDRFL